MTRVITKTARYFFILVVMTQAFSAARADIVLSQLIVDLRPGKHVRDDIEIWNNGTDRAYVALEPREILNAGLPDEARQEQRDPEKLGLLVSPSRMILEPGQRKLARIADIAPASYRERVYRVTVKPVTGTLESSDTALKILIGYDVLVLVRPVDVRLGLVGRRNGNTLVFRNQGNASVELTEGRQCDQAHARCRELPGKRLYSGAEWSQTLLSNGPVEYTIKSASGAERRTF